MGKGEKMMKNAFERMGLTARSHDRILRLARELGLPITFASDSHATEQVAWNFEELARYAAAEGWTESVYFTREGMKSMPFMD